MFVQNLFQKANTLIGFVPLIIYGVLSGNSVSSVKIALAVALIITVLIGYSDLKNRMILMWTTLLLFGSTFITVAILNITAIVPYMGILIYATFTSVTFGSILAGVPFTMQYARNMVDREFWENPGFVWVNRFMTGVWGLIFVINCILSYLVLVDPGGPGRFALPISYLVLITGAIFTIWFPDYMQRNHPLE